MQSASAVFDQLVQVLPVIEVAKLGVSMLDCLPSRDLPTPLTQAKLGAIKDLVAGKVFKDDGKITEVLNYIEFKFKKQDLNN